MMLQSDFIVVLIFQSIVTLLPTSRVEDKIVGPIHKNGGTPILQTSPENVSRKDTAGEVAFPMGEISFADSVVLYDPGAPGEGTGGEPAPEFQRPQSALGKPDCDTNNPSGYVSLGNGGTLVLKFTDNVLIDGPGPDLHISEVNGDAEDIYVWISQDRNIFIPVGKVSRKTPNIDIRPYAKPGATYSYIKLRDDPAQGEESGPSLGADIDAVGTINTAIRLEIPSDDLFIRGTARLNTDGPNILSKVAEKIRQVPNARLSIEVYTDDRGTEDFNLLLSQQQAGALRDYFVDTEQLTTVFYTLLGWGEYRPVASNDTEEGRQKNRRVKILIQPPREEIPSDERSPK